MRGAMPIKFISMFSGIEAASVAWKPLGWECLAVAEIEPFPSAVLAHHYPGVPNMGDITKVNWGQFEGKCDVVIGGPPCQAFSVAGLRKSLDDERGNLSLEFIKTVNAIKPRWVVVENVPGWLSTKDNAFGCFLAGIVGADAPLVSPLERGRWTDAGMVTGPERNAAWRILDAQYFGLAQRRRRVFIVASPRKGGNPAAVLFERYSLSRDSPPSRKKGERIAPTVTGGPPFSRTGNERVEVEALVMASGHTNAEIGIDLCTTQSSRQYKDPPIVVKSYPRSIVRRLTPTEAEFLQGFPRDYTRISWRGKPAEDCPDGSRYKCLGNSMAVPVIRWLGERIQMVEED